MNFPADESVDQQIVARLRADGHVVSYVAEMQPSLPDEVVLDMANRRGEMLLTADKHFGELVFRQRRLSQGVVLVRLAGLSPMAKAEIVASGIAEHGAELIRAFTVISAGLIRIRREDM